MSGGGHRVIISIRSLSRGGEEFANYTRTLGSWRNFSGNCSGAAFSFSLRLGLHFAVFIDFAGAVGRCEGVGPADGGRPAVPGRGGGGGGGGGSDVVRVDTFCLMGEELERGDGLITELAGEEDRAGLRGLRGLPTPTGSVQG